MTTNERDLTSLPNPYDFANPVKDIKKLYGRDEELKLIEYYLEQASLNSDPINLAILGERASGKTSLLNAIEHKASLKDICTCRINLDESDIESEIKFFFKIYDAILNSACENGAFGGMMSPTYFNYLDMISSFEVPEDKNFCPLLFPIIYATAMARNNTNILVSDSHISRDLKIIRGETTKPIVILLDEGNVMATHKNLLQKIRNIFMNLDGYMLVLVGTPEIFTTMDDVFSPITRQFIKINIAGFPSENETSKCLREPLLSPLYKDFERFEISTQTVIDIHDISSGRPYEIQYIAHHIFKSIQEGKRLEMVLDAGVLKEIREELEKSQNKEKTVLIDKYFSGEAYKITALSLFSLMEGRADVEEIYSMEYIINANNRISYEEMIDSLTELKLMGLFSEDGRSGLIKFDGDQFEKIYLKYMSINRGSQIRFSGESKYKIWARQIMRGLQTTGWQGGMGILDSKRYFSIPLDTILDRMENVADSGDNLSDIPHELLLMLYNMRIFLYREPRQNIFRIAYDNGWTQGVIIFDDRTKDESKIEKYFSKISEFNGRAEPAGRVEIRSDEIEMLDPLVLVRSMAKIENTLFLDNLVNLHIGLAINMYMQEDLNDVDLHIDAIAIYADRIHGDYNSIGYIAILREKYEEAINLLEMSLQFADMIQDKVLFNYNLAIAYLMTNNYAKSLESINESVRLYSISPDKVDNINLTSMLELRLNGNKKVVLDIREPKGIKESIYNFKKQMEEIDF